MFDTGYGHIMWSADDFGTEPPPMADNIATAIAWFVAMWVVEYTAIALLAIVAFLSGPGVPGGTDADTDSIIGNAVHRGMLGRCVNNVVVFTIMSYAGVEALAYLGGWEAHATGNRLPAGASSASMMDVVLGKGIASLFAASDAATAYGSAARIYFYLGRSQRLCMLQLTFQAKNFCDSIIHDDGVVFLLHHIATGCLAFFAMHPYLHLHAPFFFGISEVSTLFLAGLAVFDPNHGIKEMSDRFPQLMNALGACFGVLFVLLRIVVWPLVGLHFWRDGLSQFGYIEMGSSGDGGTAGAVAPPHSPPIVALFLAVNVGLSVLQLVWLKEIIDMGIVVLRGGRISSMASTAGTSPHLKKDK